MFPTSAIKLLDAHNKNVKDAKLAIVIFNRRHKGCKKK
jgi:hypothetical protein